MPRLPATQGGGFPVTNLLNHSPEFGKRWREMNEFLRIGGTVDPDIKEEARRTIAQNAGCRFCATVAGGPQAQYDDPRIAAAVRFASVASRSPTGIPDEEFEALREYFNPAETVELLAWICFNYGAEMMGAILDVDEATEDEKKIYAAYVNQLKKRRATALRA